MQDVGASDMERRQTASNGESAPDEEACCSLLAHLLLDLWQRAGPAASFSLARVLLNRCADAAGHALSQATGHNVFGCKHSSFSPMLAHYQGLGNMEDIMQFCLELSCMSLDAHATLASANFYT